MTEARQFFETIAEQHKGILYKVARTYCPSEDERQDLIQEMLIQIWQSLHRYNHQFAISTWLYRIALNVAISHHRKSSSRSRTFISLNDDLATQADTDDTDKEQQLHLLEQFISELNELDKALMLLYLDDKPHREIADILGISVSNVATRIGRIKDRLKLRFARQTF